MILSQTEAQQQAQCLLLCYPQLKINVFSDSALEFTGGILVNRTYNGYHVKKEYPLRIHLPLTTDALPLVYDAMNIIDNAYPHRDSSTGKLCLETDTCIRQHLGAKFSLVQWVRDYVEPFFFSYEYYKAYGCFPFGERAHNEAGIIQFYQEAFHVNDVQAIVDLLRIIVDQSYRRQTICPCGSKQKLRKCHGPWFMTYYNNDSLRPSIENDLKLLENLFRRNKNN